ncbi:glycine rich domain-containing protein [Pelosinus sp. IPA-1]|uniref:glycine rich domain-containing protein n=1 Tax=Pelosinus sp. IPA-1 TaxID=3029569 RepID=UPI00243623E0|nr:glycine rich domain-containing protein [Pelosinus sp. IPA-1]GMB00229.1 hypothetical protein PIPA1_30280 [Pelosinus sp. IPA-1]
MDKVNFNPFSEILVEDFLRQSGYIGDAFEMFIADFLCQSTAVLGLDVTAQSVADMTVYVKPGRIYQSGLQGQLTVNLDPALTITAAHPQYDRIDRICAQYKELQDTPEARNVMIDTVSRQVTQKSVMTRIASIIDFMVVSGVAAPAPAAPSVPDGWVSLAQVKVRSQATSILQTDIFDERPILESLATHGHSGGGDGAKLSAGNITNSVVAGIGTTDVQSTLAAIYTEATKKGGNCTRNSVITGPVDSNGNAAAIYSNLNTSTVNLKANTLINFAAGFNDRGAIDYIERVPRDISIALAGVSQTLYVYAERTAQGVISIGATEFKPITNKQIPVSYVFPNYKQLRIGDKIVFNYNSLSQTCNLPPNIKKVKIECWGASGGNSGSDLGGKGGYAYGELDVKNASNLIICVGSQGGYNDSKYGYNGGGKLNVTGDAKIWYGGGATDVRIGGGGLEKRCIVAGGGGTCDDDVGSTSGGNGGDGGGYSGGAGKSTAGVSVPSGGTQIDGGNNALFSYTLANGDAKGKFGIGASHTINYNYPMSYVFGVGGGGWYGGASGASAGGSGGSSYISGDPNCPTPHPDGIKLVNTGTIAGVNTGDGYAVITILDADTPTNTHVYKIEDGKMMYYEGGLWYEKQRVFIGEATVDSAGKVSSCKSYDYGEIQYAKFDDIRVPVPTQANQPVQLGQFLGSLGNNGWQNLPSGLIIQWGVYIVGPGAVGTYSFPIAFPNGVANITACVIGNNFASASVNVVVGFSTNSNFIAMHNQASSATICVWAIGH